MAKFIVMHPSDNVAVALEDIEGPVTLSDDTRIDIPDRIATGHKFALREIPPGESVVKYGAPIGRATSRIPPGSWVHVHNIRTNLGEEKEYFYNPTIHKVTNKPSNANEACPSFMGYRRDDGKAGIRNEVWIIPTVGCVNSLVSKLSDLGNANRLAGVDAVVAFPHPYGCSQMGDDHERTRVILANLAKHPNAAAVLVVGLGCENNTLASFRKLLDSDGIQGASISYMQAQDEEDEISAGMTLLQGLMERAAKAVRESIPVSELCVGLKCGGSDGLSGITANPLLGAFSDWLIDMGGSTILTEVPEMFGAEDSLLNRAVDRDVFERGAQMINDFKRYYLDHNQVVYENPSPGNKDGGISTLEDKSLGCTQKGGTRPVTDVIPYGGIVAKPGLTLLAGPGNDIVAATALTAAGAHVILFTTGRGTPLGGPVPVAKVSTNSRLAGHKANWIDFDAGPIAEGKSVSEILPQFVQLIVEIASGRKTKSEANGYRDFAIFKDGVTL